MELLFIVLLSFGLLLHGSTVAKTDCARARNDHARMDITWLNLDYAVQRNAFMVQQLEFYGLKPHVRVNALIPPDVYIPDEISSNINCYKLSNESVPTVTALDQVRNSSTAQMAVLLSHCGRRKNRKREATVTISHLNVIRKAIYEGNASNPYALILEDDLQFAVEIDFSALIASAPGNFGILQLVTSNDYAVLELWRVYTRHKQLWVKRKDKDDYWCAGAYIINKAIMKRYIDRIITPIAPNWLGVHLIAGYEKPTCTPAFCCKRGEFVFEDPICVKAGRGYASDNYIYNIPYGNAYMLTVPIVTGGALGNSSSLHQDHVSYHVGAFHRINTLVEEMSTGAAPMPSFMNKNCAFNRTASSTRDMNINST